MTIIYHEDFIQGSDSWVAARLGLLTASEMHLIVTPTLKIASNEKERSHIYELLAQRITKYVEPQYISDAMLRGQDDEIEAVKLYAKNYAPVKHVGFITNDKWGFTLGYSPDGLVGDNGLIECKSRAQKYQVKTIVDYYSGGNIDPDFMIQVQTALLVSEREWCDLISYCGGLPMVTTRCFAEQKYQDAIIAAATAFEAKLAGSMETYNFCTADKSKAIPTERRVIQEIF